MKRRAQRQYVMCFDVLDVGKDEHLELHRKIAKAGVQVDHLAPLVAAMFPKDAYDPLAEPTRGVERLRPWRDLLCVGDGYTDGGIFGTDTDDAVYGLVSESVIQPLRRAISNNWDPKSPEPLLRFFDNWSVTVLSTDSVEALQLR